MIRRNTTAGELAFYRCWTPGTAGLALLVRVAGIRWIVEEGFQTAKGQVGLEQHQVRRWQSWHRFTTLALAALAVLAICAADASTTVDDHAQPDRTRLSVNEIRRLFNILILHPTPAPLIVCTGQPGDYDTWHEPDKPTTPAVSASIPTMITKGGCRTRRCTTAD